MLAQIITFDFHLGGIDSFQRANKIELLSKNFPKGGVEVGIKTYGIFLKARIPLPDLCERYIGDNGDDAICIKTHNLIEEAEHEAQISMGDKKAVWLCVEEEIVSPREAEIYLWLILQ